MEQTPILDELDNDFEDSYQDEDYFDDSDDDNTDQPGNLLPEEFEEFEDHPDDSKTMDFKELNNIDIELSIEVGQTTIPLTEIRRLSTGSIIRTSGCDLGQARLCQNNKPIAYGDLVEVDGSLGLQITSFVSI